jgi:hypothetical protein
MTINSSQVVNFANAPTVAGSALPSGAMTLISTQTASSSSTLSFTGLTGYNKYLLIITDLILSSAGNYPYFQIGTGATPTYLSSGYAYCYVGSGSNVTGASGGASVNGSYMRFAQISAEIATTTATYSGYYYFIGMNNSAVNSQIIGNTSAFDNLGNSGNGTYSSWNLGGGVGTSSTVKTAILLANQSGTFVSGTVSLYGISS